MVILAAGASTRLGSPKALLNYQGCSLLEHTVKTVTGCKPAVWCLVTGAHHEAMRAALPQLEAHMHYNAAWQDGMASSIRTGLSVVQTKGSLNEGVFFLVCDQPLISTRLLREMAQAKKRSRKSIVACAYAHTLGIPVLFSPRHYPALAALQGEKGAKNLILAHSDEVAAVSFKGGEIDIDTAEDYERLLERKDPAWL